MLGMKVGSFLVGVAVGVYIDQNYKVPKFIPKEVYDTILKTIESWQKDDKDK